MNAKDLELKISGLEKAIEEKTADASRFQDELKTTQKTNKRYTPIKYVKIRKSNARTKHGTTKCTLKVKHAKQAKKYAPEKAHKKHTAHEKTNSTWH